MNVQDVFVCFSLFTVLCAMTNWRTATAMKETTLRHNVPLSSNTPKNAESHGTMPPKTRSKKERTKNTMTITTQKASVATTIRPKSIGKSAPSGRFARHVLTDLFFVDKTSFIHDLMVDDETVISISRPRMWGKSLMLDMMNEFLNINADFLRFENHKKKLAILNSTFKSFRETHMNQHIVIHVDLSEAVGETFDVAWGELKDIIASIFDQFKYLLKREGVTKREKKNFMDIIAKTADNPTYTGSIRFLSKLIFDHHNVGPIILIDEADSLPASAASNNYTSHFNGTLFTFFHKTLKTNVPPKKIIIFSVLPVFRMMILASVNNVATYTISDKQFDSILGFTREEVEKLITESNRGSTLSINELSEWYNQIKVGDRDVFNPKSVKECLKNGRLGTYTPHFSGSLEAVTDRILKGSGLLPLLEFAVLIKVGTLKKCIRPKFQLDRVFSDLDSMWSYCFHAGFIAKAGPSTIKLAGLEVQNLLIKDYIPQEWNSTPTNHDLMFQHVRDRNVAGVRQILLPWIQKAGEYLMRHEARDHVSIFILNDYLNLIFRLYDPLYGIEVLTKVTNLERDIAMEFNFRNLTCREWLTRKFKGPFEVVVKIMPSTELTEKDTDFASCVKIGSDCMNIVKGSVYLFRIFHS